MAFFIKIETLPIGLAMKKFIVAIGLILVFALSSTSICEISWITKYDKVLIMAIKILVNGASGFIGSSFLEEISKTTNFRFATS